MIVTSQRKIRSSVRDLIRKASPLKQDSDTHVVTMNSAAFNALQQLQGAMKAGEQDLGYIMQENFGARDAGRFT